METKLLELHEAGLFYNVNLVIDQLYLAEQYGYKIAIGWSRSCYKDRSMGGDPWNYYFENVFHNTDTPKETLKVKLIREGNIITPRQKKGECGIFLLLPDDRYLANSIISKYIKPKSHIKEKISNFQIKLIGIRL